MGLSSAFVWSIDQYDGDDDRRGLFDVHLADRARQVTLPLDGGFRLHGAMPPSYITIDWQVVVYGTALSRVDYGVPASARVEVPKACAEAAAERAGLHPLETRGRV